MEKVKGHEMYLVSKEGKVFSLYKNRFLKICVVGGYCYVELNKKSYSIHRLVAMAYIDNPEKKPCVNHIDGNKLNNHVSNLEWVTYKENTKHAYDTGLKKPLRGKENGSAKKIIDVKTKQIFDTVNEAASYMNMKRPTLSNMLTGFRRNKTNLRYL